MRYAACRTVSWGRPRNIPPSDVYERPRVLQQDTSDDLAVGAGVGDHGTTILGNTADQTIGDVLRPQRYVLLPVVIARVRSEVRLDRLLAGVEILQRQVTGSVGQHLRDRIECYVHALPL